MPQRTNTDLDSFLASVQSDMATEYERITARSKSDPGTAGDEGEEHWAALIRRWIPRQYYVVTKGCILGEDGEPSPQMDVVILKPSYPPGLLEKKTYLAGGVAAAFECKLTLRATGIDKTFKNAVALRKIIKPRSGSPFRILNSGIRYGLLAQSHEWAENRAAATINDYLVKFDKQYVTHPREMLDLICVADVATWAAMRDPWFPPTGQIATNYTNFLNLCPRPRFPIASFLSHLLLALGWEDRSIRPISEYFLSAGYGDEGVSDHHRSWPINLFPEPMPGQLMSRTVLSGAHIPPESGCWNEWRTH